MTNLTQNIFLAGSIIMFALLLKYGRRHTRVWIFCHRMNQLALAWSMRHLDEIVAGTEQDAYQWFIPKTPKYHKMIFSNKPLTLEAWFDQDIIDRLKS